MGIHLKSKKYNFRHPALNSTPNRITGQCGLDETVNCPIS
jgi:hypothetical protein